MAHVTRRTELTDRPLLEVLRWRFTNGNITYWGRLGRAVGATLTMCFLNVSIYLDGHNPWSLLAPLLAPASLYLFVWGWAYGKGLHFLYGFILLMIGSVFPLLMLD